MVPMLPELNHITVTSAGEGLEKLPRYSGVYRFYDASEALLYIGKSIDIHARINAHVQEGRKPGRHQRIMGQVSRIDCMATSGEVGALLMENAAIKSETPLYNRRQRRVRKLWTIHLSLAKTGFLLPSASDFLTDSDRAIDSYGLYHNRRHIDSTLRRHARDHGLCLRCLGMDRGHGPCFQYQLGRCDGACAGEESSEDHNARLLSVLDRDRIAAWPFTGALALLERNTDPLPGQPARQYHLVDHWSYLGSFYSLEDVTQRLLAGGDRHFDRDGYHLLIAALGKGRLEVLDAASGQVVDNPMLGMDRRSWV
ncbi:MAG: GIY-YIG nuclease family protein [Luminiphilus sp.]|nr:GIY-YIG nuclease family protein [Luminiphilus sp.]